jgi:hypothetical protein
MARLRRIVTSVEKSGGRSLLVQNERLLRPVQTIARAGDPSVSPTRREHAITGQ